MRFGAMDARQPGPDGFVPERPPPRGGDRASAPPADNTRLHDSVLIQESVLAPERFGPLFDRHAAAVHRYLARRIGPPADDLLAETFLVAFRRRAAYRPQHIDVRPWLFGIATNMLHRYARQEKRRYRMLARVSLEECPDSAFADDAAGRVDACALRRELAAALATLKGGDRDVLLLVAWAGLTYAEIAVALGIPVGTVRSRLNRARRLTRAALNQAGIQAGITEELS